jgi:hypothetical protein
LTAAHLFECSDGARARRFGIFHFFNLVGGSAAAASPPLATRVPAAPLLVIFGHILATAPQRALVAEHVVVVVIVAISAASTVVPTAFAALAQVCVVIIIRRVPLVACNEHRVKSQHYFEQELPRIKKRRSFGSSTRTWEFFSAAERNGGFALPK